MTTVLSASVKTDTAELVTAAAELIFMTHPDGSGHARMSDGYISNSLVKD